MDKHPSLFSLTMIDKEKGFIALTPDWQMQKLAAPPPGPNVLKLCTTVINKYLKLANLLALAGLSSIV
jgi:hypothetical protein